MLHQGKHHLKSGCHEFTGTVHSMDINRGYMHTSVCSSDQRIDILEDIVIKRIVAGRDSTAQQRAQRQKSECASHVDHGDARYEESDALNGFGKR